REGFRDTSIDLADRPLFNKEAEIVEHPFSSIILKQYRDGVIMVAPIFSDRDNQSKESFIEQTLLVSDRLYKNSGLIRNVEMGNRIPRLESVIYELTIFAQGNYRDSTSIEQVHYTGKRIKREMAIETLFTEGKETIRNGDITH